MTGRAGREEQAVNAGGEPRPCCGRQAPRQGTHQGPRVHESAAADPRRLAAARAAGLAACAAQAGITPGWPGSWQRPAAQQHRRRQRLRRLRLRARWSALQQSGAVHRQAALPGHCHHGRHPCCIDAMRLPLLLRAADQAPGSIGAAICRQVRWGQEDVQHLRGGVVNGGPLLVRACPARQPTAGPQVPAQPKGLTAGQHAAVARAGGTGRPCKARGRSMMPP